MSDTSPNDLLLHLNSIHTTEIGIERITRNLSLNTDDVVSWCRDRITDSKTTISRQGKTGM